MTTDNEEPIRCITCLTPDNVAEYQDPVNGNAIEFCTNIRCAAEYFSRSHPNPKTIPFEALHKINMILMNIDLGNKRYKKWK